MEGLGCCLASYGLSMQSFVVGTNVVHGMCLTIADQLQTKWIFKFVKMYKPVVCKEHLHYFTMLFFSSHCWFVDH